MVAPKTTVIQQFYFPPGGRPGGRGYAAYIFRAWERQMKPYNLQTAQTKIHVRTTGLVNFDGFNVATGFGSTQAHRPWLSADFYDAVLSDPNLGWFRGHHYDAMNMALKRLQGSAHNERASLGAALGELPETVKMISNRVEQLLKGARQLKRLDFYGFAVTFGLTRKKRPKDRRAGRTGKLYWRKHPIKNRWFPSPEPRWKHSRNFSSLWLEYSFGWAPTVKDVQSAVSIISETQVYETKIRGGGSASGSNTYELYAYYLYRYTHTIKVRAACGGTFRITNPNYDLLSRLGLTNLASVALEVTPFSFVFNWLLNLEEFVGNLSDDYRANLQDVWHSYRVWSTASTSSVDPYGTLQFRQDTRADSYNRIPDVLPATVLRFRSRFMPSFTRALNASSLLVQLFGGKRIA